MFTGNVTLLWRHNGRGNVSNHQPHNCLINRLFRRKSKKTSKLRVTGLCTGNSPGTGEFAAQMASNAQNVSIWWRHHESKGMITCDVLSNRAGFYLICHLEYLLDICFMENLRYFSRPRLTFVWCISIDVPADGGLKSLGARASVSKIVYYKVLYSILEQWVEGWT